jgi:cytochrome oxidase Cu insertion factor (SCO1/SenC/PrrC family)
MTAMRLAIATLGWALLAGFAGAARANGAAPYALGERVAATGLVTQDARPFRFDDGSGRVTALSFIYTQCRDADGCPTITARFVRLESLVDRSRVRLVLLTIAPLEDTPAALRRYGAVFHADPSRLTFVTGSPPAIAALAERFEIAGTQRDPDAALDHAERLIVLDGSAHVADRIDGGAWLPDDAAAAIAAVAGLAHSPLRQLAVHLTWLVEHRCGLPASGVAASLHHFGVATVLLIPPGPLLALVLLERRRRRRD